MPYSKYHFIDQACSTFSKKMDSLKKFSLSYVALECKKRTLDFSLTIKELIAQFNKSERIINFLSTTISEFLDLTMDSFLNVKESELIEFITNYFSDNSSITKSDFMITPWKISNLSARLLDIQESDDVADFCSGTGSFSFLLNKNYDVKNLDCFELNNDLCNISEIIADSQNMSLSIIQKDLLTEDVEKKYSKIFCDIPFCAKISDSAIKEKFENNLNIKNVRSEYIFIQKVLDSLDENGKAIVSIPLGILFGGPHCDYLKYLLENKFINAVIQFAPSILQNTRIPFALLILSFNNENVRVINASNIYTKTRWKNELTVENISKIELAYLEDTKISKNISMEEIIAADYNLLPARYFSSQKIYLPDNVKIEHKFVKLADLVTTITRGVQYKANALDDNSTLAPTNNFYLTLTGIQDNRIIESLPNLSEIEQRNEKYCLKEGDIVIPCILKDSMKIAIAENLDNKKIIAASSLYIIRVKNDIISPYYLKIILESNEAEVVFESLKNNISALSVLSVFDLKNIEIPLISMEEQNKLVNKYLGFQSQIKSLEKQLSQLKNDRDSLLKIWKR